MIRSILAVIAAIFFFIAAMVSFGWFGSAPNALHALGYMGIGLAILAVTYVVWDVAPISRRGNPPV